MKRVVDFGHSFSPIIEMKSLGSSNELTHGQAVALDVLYSCGISAIRNMMSPDDLFRVYKVAKALTLPINHPSFEDPLLLLESLNDTVKHRNGDQNLPIPESIGHSVFLNDLTYEEIKRAVDVQKQFYKKVKG